jgi:hypothetical protein
MHQPLGRRDSNKPSSEELGDCIKWLRKNLELLQKMQEKI